VGLAILHSNAISLEDFLSFLIAIGSDNERYILFAQLCKNHFTSMMFYLKWYLHYAKIALTYGFSKILNIFLCVQLSIE